MNNEQIETCRLVLLHYGERPQILKAIEELGECVQALAKIVNDENCRRDFFKGKDLFPVISEIADCKIMLQQMEILITEQICNETVIDRMINSKLNRVLTRITGKS